ncbi:helix-turn-helix domain-containing protein [Flavobacterium sp.]|uniref:helix-turn-helix domain-containing protein n=1 Tax=Flavobacterium sp. TaxID=239 RepID=UPI0034252E17
MYLCTKEVANKLQVSKMTISRMVKNGRLKPINTQKRFFLFNANEIDCLTSNLKTDVK